MKLRVFSSVSVAIMAVVGLAAPATSAVSIAIETQRTPTINLVGTVDPGLEPAFTGNNLDGYIRSSGHNWFACQYPVAGSGLLERRASAGQAEAGEFTGSADVTSLEWFMGPMGDFGPTSCLRLVVDLPILSTQSETLEVFSIDADSSKVNYSSAAIDSLNTTYVEQFPYFVYVDVYTKTGSPDLIAVSKAVAHMERSSQATLSLGQTPGLATLNVDPTFSGINPFKREFRGLVACDTQISTTIYMPSSVLNIYTTNNPTTSDSNLTAFEVSQSGQPVQCRVFNSAYSNPFSFTELFDPVDSQAKAYDSTQSASYGNLTVAHIFFYLSSPSATLTAENARVFFTNSVPYTAPNNDSPSQDNNQPAQFDIDLLLAGRANMTLDASAGTSVGDVVSVSTLDPWTLDGVDGHTVTPGWVLFDSGCSPGSQNPGYPMLYSTGSDYADLTIDSSLEFTVPASAIYRKNGSVVTADLTSGGLHIGPKWTLSKAGYGPIGFIGQVFEVGGEVCPCSSSNQNDSQDAAPAAPYTGPILNTPAITSSIPVGGKVVIPGNNLSGVSSVEIGGVAATVVLNSDGELEISVPEGLAAGTYDLVVVSSSGRLTVQNAITVSATRPNVSASEPTPSTRRLADDSVKVWVFDVAGAGKVQIFVNGKEIAWVRTNDENDSKLTGGYLVRTVDLVDGKNVIEVYVDGERVRRNAYSR